MRNHTMASLLLLLLLSACGLDAVAEPSAAVAPVAAPINSDIGQPCVYDADCHEGTAPHPVEVCPGGVSRCCGLQGAVVDPTWPAVPLGGPGGCCPGLEPVLVGSGWSCDDCGHVAGEDAADSGRCPPTYYY
jgi:hypothetical protein